MSPFGQLQRVVCVANRRPVHHARTNLPVVRPGRIVIVPGGPGAKVDMRLSTEASKIGDSALDLCIAVKANYQLPWWANFDDRSKPGRTIKLTG